MAVDLDTAKSRLLERRRALRELEAGRGEERQAVELDQTKVGRLSRMDAMQSQQMALALKQRQRQQLIRVEKALEAVAGK